MTEIQTPPERRTKAGLVPSLVNPAWTAGREASVGGWYAVVSEGDRTLEVSKLDGEAGWTVDASWGRGSMPIHANGYGARYLRTRRLSDEAAAALDARIAPTAFTCNACDSPEGPMDPLMGYCPACLAETVGR